jgi:hypothetical protein
MSMRSKHYMFMGKVSYIISAAMMIAALVTNLFPPQAASASPVESKVYVCKYVGTPGVNEQLQTGQNPIEVSVNAFKVPIVVGAYFADDQGRSYVLGYVPMNPEPTAANCPPPAPGNASASVSAGNCTWSQAAGSLTPVTITLVGASLTINGVTYPSSTTINLPPGTYPYTWTALTGYTGAGSGSVVIGDCTPGDASASVSAGNCTWSQAAGSLTPLTITLVGASLTINGQTYSASTTIDLAPGTYPYTWTALSGYTGSGSGSVTIGDCTPPDASASVSAGTCSWNAQDGSLTPLTITLVGASLTINGQTYTASTTIDLAPGTYPYTWTALSGYKGSGSGSVVIGDCSPGNAFASVTTGTCTWSLAAGSLTPLTITLTGASLTINGQTYTASTTIDLAPGTYPYSWIALPDFNGSGSGSVTIGECTPPDASASVSAGTCSWNAQAGSLTPVTITLVGASLTINGQTYTASTTIDLAPGTYPYTWTALSGYKGSGSGSVTIGDCTPPDASASVSAGTCSWNAQDGSLTPLTITLVGASLTINGQTYTASTTIDLAPGTYPYTWTALSGYKGSGSGSVTIGECTPPDASASVSAGTCSWNEQDGSLTPLTITLVGASLTINGQTYSASTTIDLAPGTYPYTWTALSGYKGSGSGSVVIGDCTPGNATASVTTGNCSYTKETGSLTPLTITLTGASLTINGQTYISSTTIDLAPGTYPYSWTALPDFNGSGSGSVVIGDCTPAMTMVKSADPLTYSNAGDEIDYSYLVTNTGKIPLTGISVTDDKASVNCPKDTLAEDESMTCTASYAVAQGDIDLGSVTNHAAAVSDQTDPANDEATVTAIQTPELTIEKSVTEKTYTLAGDLLHYSYLVTNTGNVTLTGVGVTDDKTTVVCPKTTLVPEESMTCMATYTVRNADLAFENITNTAFASGLFGEQDVQSDPDSATVIRFHKLILSAICAADPAANNGWLVANNNTYPVDYEYSIDGGVAGVGTVPANSTATINTPLGSGTGVMSLYAAGILQNNATPKTGCNENPPPPVPGCMDPTALNYNANATQNDGSCIYGGGAGAAILIPVTGVDMGLLGRTLPGSLFGLSFSFAGLGLVLSGLARRRED